MIVRAIVHYLKKQKEINGFLIEDKFEEFSSLDTYIPNEIPKLANENKDNFYIQIVLYRYTQDGNNYSRHEPLISSDVVSFFDDKFVEIWYAGYIWSYDKKTCELVIKNNYINI